MHSHLRPLALSLTILMLAACTGPGTSDGTPQERAGEVTSLLTTWVQDDWQVEEIDEDLCAGGAAASPYELADGSDHVICGDYALGARACALDDDGATMTFIVDAIDQTALRFRSSSAAAGLDAEGTRSQPMPLALMLVGDVSCEPRDSPADASDPPALTVLPDGTDSWYRCSDGSVLLSGGGADDTFDRGERWTVQRYAEGGESETVIVDWAMFADHANPTVR
ncbi:hypothetical protein Bequi_12405 [Brachybacterium sp. JHP9]|uniref:Uncharacterized protein n=1 Tax=Brachybacterium equifaecis TaxID=2910770 RepID=A0ABT0R2K5_9MICO|nr:hypothetical protein [Brachybacterium equifaecis]MCL6424169.1 hypothetical protein [Brachybacterium equifaecis]